jgi:hypothetical protein
MRRFLVAILGKLIYSGEGVLYFRDSFFREYCRGARRNEATGLKADGPGDATSDRLLVG